MKRSISFLVVVLRWIAVLPAALAAYFAVQLLIALLSLTMPEGHSDSYLQLLNSFAGAYGAVYAGAHTAPKHQFTVAIILASLFAIVTIGIMVLAYELRATHPFWWLTLASLISLGGVIVAVVQLRREAGKA